LSGSERGRHAGQTPPAAAGSRQATREPAAAAETYSRPAPPRLTDAELADRIRAVARPEAAARLSDGVVRLRTWTAADAPAIVDGLRDGSAAYWIVDMPHPYGPAEAGDFLTRAERELRSAEYAHLAVADATTGRVLGAIGMNFRHDRQAGEIGYWTHPGERRRGIARRAVALVSGWAFEELRLPRVELIIHPLNFESQVIASRSGFRREGLLRSYLEHRGLRNDYYSFARLPDDPPPRPHPVLSLEGVQDGVDPVDPAARTTVGDVELRPWQLRDAEAALQMLTGDEQITRWYVEIAPEMSIDEERRFIAEAARAWQEDHLPVLAIVDAAGGGLLGSCGAQRSRFAGVAELGYLVREAVRGGGIAAAALDAVTEWVLADGRYGVCELLIAPENSSSIRTAERCGYVRSGEIRSCSTRGLSVGLHEAWRRTR
jgi:RimJ/RimL family protein N-acetyltransferase